MGQQLGCCVPQGVSDAFTSLNIRFMRKKKEEKALRSAGAELSEPFAIDWTKARPENWKFESTTGPGSYFFKFEPEIDDVKGPISDGEKKLKSRPENYEGMMYQTSMKDWPADQQSYKLVKRTGSGYSFTAGQSENFTYVQAKYQALERYDRVSLDPDPYTDSMSFRRQRLGKPCHPGRGQGICDVPHIKIIGEIHPNDIIQGSVGDCWLLSAISALSEFEGAIATLFRNTRYVKDLPKNSPQKYIITLYDMKTWQPVDIEVDERLCMKPDGSDLLGCHPSYDGELWACYVEKAVAIHCGGWDEIDGGQCTHAWRLLTGCKYQYTFMNSGDNQFQCLGKFNPNTKEWDPLENSGHKGSQGLWPMDWPEVGGGGDKRAKCGLNEMFERMCAWDDQNYVMAAGTKAGSDTNTTDGIVDGHAYTVITCLNDVAGTEHDLIKVRNPWGKGEFTSGQWCDDGPGWTDYPQVKNVCKPTKANDGVFWLSKEEFFKYFRTVYLCAQDMTAFIK